MDKRKMKTGILVSALMGCFAIGGISAYFTDADTAKNTFTVGKVRIDLQEPGWTAPVNITPLQEFQKDPQVKNTGINDAYIFAEVTVPFERTVTANEDGTKNERTDTELFTYDVKEGWIELRDQRVVDQSAGIVKRLYAYSSDHGMTAVGPGKTTNPLFERIKFANVVEEEGFEEKELDVTVHAYGIQTANINDGKADPAEIWSVLAAQTIDPAGAEE